MSIQGRKWKCASQTVHELFNPSPNDRPEFTLYFSHTELRKEGTIQMKTKRTMILLLAVLTLILMMGGAAMAESQQSTQPQQNGTLGQVTQIDGNAITIALGTMGGPGGQNGQAAQGNPPTGSNGQAAQGNPPTDSNGQAAQGNPPTGSNGQAAQGNPPTDSNGQAPQGNAPDGGQGPSLTLTGESLTFTVNDATVITLRGGHDAQDTTGALSDIAVGSILTIVLSDNVATSISVQQTPAAPAATTAPAGN